MDAADAPRDAVGRHPDARTSGESPSDRRRRGGPTRTLVVFGAVLVAALAGGIAVGAWVGGDDDRPTTETPVTTAHVDH